MNIDILLFYLFSIFALLSSIMVISLSNAVHSVLFLILVFCNTSGLLLLLGVEFLAFLLLIVYVGAIAVLFLFVVMMLNIKVHSLNMNWLSIFPITLLLLFVFYHQFIEFINSNFIYFETTYTEIYWINWIIENNNYSNIETIGKVLYTNYFFLFLICGLILLVAMIGAIVLTMHQNKKVKKQKIDIQLNRKPSRSIKFIYLRK